VGNTKHSTSSCRLRSEEARGEALAHYYQPTSHPASTRLLGLRPVPSLAPDLYLNLTSTSTTLTTARNSLSAPTTAPPNNPSYAVAPAESVSRSDDIDALSREASDPNLQ
jgi:hypothetical protein